jgi:hypothetical protein
MLLRQPDSWSRQPEYPPALVLDLELPDIHGLAPQQVLFRRHDFLFFFLYSSKDWR